MFPGLVTRLSEEVISLTNTILPRRDIQRVTSTATTTVLVTVIAPFSNMGGILFLINGSGAAITATTAGNIATTCSIPNNCVAVMVYSPSAAKWYFDKTL